MRKKLADNEKKITIAITINPILDKKLTELYKNKSKQVEWLIYQHLLKNNNIEEMPL
jgi:hypothetical protein